MELLNAELRFPNNIQRLFDNARYATVIDTYRSRTEINFRNIHVISVLYSLLTGRTNATSINTKAYPKTDTSDDTAFSLMVSCLPNNRNYLNILFINMNTNKSATDTLLNNFLKTNEFALAEAITDPKSGVSFKIIINKGFQPGGHQVVVLSDEYDDAAFIRTAPYILKTIGVAVPEEMFEAHMSCDMEKVCAVLNKYIAQYEDLKRKENVTKILNDLMESSSKLEDTATNNNINGIKRQITESYDTLKNLYKQLEELEMKLSSKYFEKIKTAYQEFAEYVLIGSIDQLLAMNRQGNKLYYLIETTLDYWDEGVYDRYCKSPVNNPINSKRGAEKALLDDIFKHKLIKVIWNTPIRVDFDNNSVAFYQFTEAENVRRSLMHPHLRYANCFGSNMQYISKAFSKRDYVVLWEQLKSTVSGINIPDGGIFENFINSDLFREGRDMYCLMLPDTKERLTVTEYIKRFPNGIPREEQTIAIS